MLLCPEPERGGALLNTENEVLFARSASVADRIERLLSAATLSVDAALYRLDESRMAAALGATARRGSRVRLILDRGKFEQNPLTRELLSKYALPYKLADGRRAEGSKMHHKFAILDGRVVLTGSYNWTSESEEGNYENLLILSDANLVKAYAAEFGWLWDEAAEVPRELRMDFSG